MKFIKILQKHRQANTEKIKDFIKKNMTQEMIQGIEHDDPKTIKRALKLFNIDYDPTTKESQDLNSTTKNEQSK